MTNSENSGGEVIPQRLFDRVAIAIGLILLLAGILMWSEFSPSPHGYLEIFCALPVMDLGLGLTGLILGSGRFARGLTWLGRAMIVVALLPVLLVVLLMITGIVLGLRTP